MALPGGGTEAERLTAFESAFALRERVTLPERLEIEGLYHYHITGEENRVLEAFETLKKTYPRRAAFRRAVNDVHLWAGQLDEALAEAREAERLEPNGIINLIAVGRAYLYSGRLAEAEAAAERGIALGGTHPFLHFILFQCALASRNQQILARERAWAAVHPDAAMSYIGEAEAEEAMSRGRLEEALGFLRQIENLAAASGQPRTAAAVRLRMARYEALCGLEREALLRVADEMRAGFTPTLRIDAIKVAVSAGDFALAARLLDEAERESPVGTGQPDATLMRAYRAAIEAANGRTDQALALLTPLEPADLGIAYGFIPLFERARAYERAGNWTMARGAFEKILAHPTIDSGRKLIPLAQLGLARTLARQDDVAASRRAYEQFFERWKNADARLPLLGRARTEYQALKER